MSTTTATSTTNSTLSALVAKYSNNSSSTSTTTNSTSTLGQDAFLKMFMAQMTNQNPLDPMDNTEFVAQLAQFSSLEQLTQINTALESLTSMSETLTQTQALSYLGKEVTMSGNQLALNSGVAGTTSFSLAANASVQAIITDSEGSIVSSFSLGNLSAGENSFIWDGLKSDGSVAPDGTYTVSLLATDSSGSSVTVSDVSTTGVVTGYKIGSDGVTYLLVGDAELPLSSVTKVTTPSTTSTTTTSMSDWLSEQYNSYLNSSSSNSTSNSTGFYDWLVDQVS